MLGHNHWQHRYYPFQDSTGDFHGSPASRSYLSTWQDWSITCSTVLILRWREADNTLVLGLQMDSMMFCSTRILSSKYRWVLLFNNNPTCGVERSRVLRFPSPWHYFWNPKIPCPEVMVDLVTVVIHVVAINVEMVGVGTYKVPASYPQIQDEVRPMNNLAHSTIFRFADVRPSTLC